MTKYDMVTWRELIERNMSTYKNEDWSKVKDCTLTEDELDVEFYDGYGGIEGKDFTLWTKNRVYFPTEYDGSEGCRSVSRRIDRKPSKHW